MPSCHSTTVATQDTLSPRILCCLCAMLPADRSMIWLQDAMAADEALPRCCDLCWYRAERSVEARAWKARRRLAPLKRPRRRTPTAITPCASCSVSLRRADSGVCSC